MTKAGVWNDPWSAVRDELHAYRRLLVRHERHADLYQGFAQLACAFIAVVRL